MRVKIVLSYNGNAYFGSQIQPDKKTVFGELQDCLKNLGITSQPIPSSRTDRGVHAISQVCHIDLPSFWSDTNKLKNKLNAMLTPSLHVKSIVKTTNNFHARYDAKKRVYRYIIKQGEPNPFKEQFITFLPKIDFEKVSQNIKLFQGEHDFKYFAKTGSDTKTTKRNIFRSFAYKHKDYIILHFKANGFLRGQVRLMVSALINLNKQEITNKLSLKQNYKLKPSPANGLYLAKVIY